MPRPLTKLGHGKQPPPPSPENITVTTSIADFPDNTLPVKPRKRDRIWALLTPQSSNLRSRSPSPAPPGSVTAPRALHGPTINTNVPETNSNNSAQELGTGYRALSSPSKSKLAPNNQPPVPDGNIGAQFPKPDNRVTASSQLASCHQTAELGIHQGQTGPLWIEAYNKLSSDDKINLEIDKLDNLQELLDIADEAKQKCISDQWTIPWGDRTIKVREMAESLMTWITKFRDIGDIAVQYDPAHAALPWAGVRLIITVCNVKPRTALSHKLVYYSCPPLLLIYHRCRCCSTHPRLSMDY